MKKNFKDLGISPPIIKAIEKINYIVPSKVQSQVIPLVLKKEDLIVMSKTGSGKTGAFAIPILQMIKPDEKGPQGLILTPTRELAVQVDNDIKKMSKYLNITTNAVYGQHNMGVEVQTFKKGVSIVTGTPGRVLHHISKKTLVTNNIKYLVIDEADRMLDMGFIDQVVKIIKVIPKNRVTLLFSATIPTEIQRICKAYMKKPVTIELESNTKTVDTIKQIYYRVEPNEKRLQLNKILKVEQPDRCIVFCNTRFAVDKVNAFLSRKGYITASIHGGNSQNSRMRTIQRLKRGSVQIVIATDVAARGIHIDNLNLVINYDVPMDNDSYVHRIGRTGRSGNSGKAISLVTSDDIMSLYEIEEHVGVLIEERDIPTDAFVQECIEKASGKWAKPKKERPVSQSKKPVRQVQENNNINNKQSESKVKEVNDKNIEVKDFKKANKRSIFDIIIKFIKGRKNSK